jgi:DNA-directed RNA polymerase subunit K/omega
LTTNETKIEEIQPLANSEKLTCSVLTKFEKARILGVRARQIREHTALYINLTEAERKKMSPI